MEKKVFVLSRHWMSQMADRIWYELKHDNNIMQTTKFDATKTPEVFDSFVKEFRITTFPVIQIGENDGRQWTTIHMDPNHEEQIQGAGGKQIRDFTYIKVDSIDEMVNKALEIYKR